MSSLTVAVSAGLLLLIAGAHAQVGVHKPEEPGLTIVGPGWFPTPEGMTSFEVQNGDFTGGTDGWGFPPDLARVVPEDAPDGGPFLQHDGGEQAGLTSPYMECAGGRPHLMSMWLRSTEPFNFAFSTDCRHRWMGTVTLRMPDTQGQWRRAGCYFRAPHTATTGRLVLARPREGGVAAFDLGGLRLRTATEAELAAGYDAWRAQYPARDLSPRPDDGEHLATSIAKLRGDLPLDPPRPFVIYAVGSSFTNKLGLGDTIIQELRRRFPSAPEIVYKKHVGASVAYSHVRGWVSQFVIPEHPDLILIYTLGSAEDMDLMLAEIRARTTADVIVPSLHVLNREGEIGEATMNDPKWEAVREVCARHQVEWVDNRREWCEYVMAQGGDVDYLLADAVHQSTEGALVINENIVRHFSPERALDPADVRERRVPVTEASVVRQGRWTLTTDPLAHAGPTGTGVQAGDPVLLGPMAVTTGVGAQGPHAVAMSSTEDASLTLSFAGNRLDLIGVRLPGGGEARVLVDGVPADELPVFQSTYIQPGPDNARGPDLAGDRAPHLIGIGENVVPQNWTMTVTSAEGDFKLEGSVTGPDGTGRSTEAFVSDSGQVVMDPAMWRRPERNEVGDIFTWEVYRCALGRVSFRAEGEQPERFRLQLVDGLSNSEHTLQLIAVGDGPVAGEGFEVFEPPLR